MRAYILVNKSMKLVRGSMGDLEYICQGVGTSEKQKYPKFQIEKTTQNKNGNLNNLPMQEHNSNSELLWSNWYCHKQPDNK